jgi:hypothetical protein
MAPRVTLSWAEILLMLMLVLGGWGAWALGVRYLGGQPDAATASRPAAGDAPLAQIRGDVDRWREALLKERLETARMQAQLAWLQGHYPGLASTPAAGAPAVPDEARTGHETAVRNLYVSSQVTRAIEAGLASAESDLQMQQAFLAKRSTDTTSSKQSDVRWARIWSAGLVAALVVTFSFALRFRKTPTAINSRRVVGVACFWLLVLITYDVFGAPALMLASLALGFFLARAATVTP